jgi:hypothetical protein
MAANLRCGDDSRLSFKCDTGQFAAIKLALGDELRAFVGQIDCPTKVLRDTRGPGDVIDEAVPARQKAVVPDPLHAVSGVAGRRSAVAVPCTS